MKMIIFALLFGLPAFSMFTLKDFDECPEREAQYQAFDCAYYKNGDPAKVKLFRGQLEAAIAQISTDADSPLGVFYSGDTKLAENFVGNLKKHGLFFGQHSALGEALTLFLSSNLRFSRDLSPAILTYELFFTSRLVASVEPQIALMVLKRMASRNAACRADAIDIFENLGKAFKGPEPEVVWEILKEILTDNNMLDTRKEDFAVPEGWREETKQNIEALHQKELARQEKQAKQKKVPQPQDNLPLPKDFVHPPYGGPSEEECRRALQNFDDYDHRDGWTREEYRAQLRAFEESRRSPYSR